MRQIYWSYDLLVKVSLQGVAWQHVIMNNNHTRVSVQRRSLYFHQSIRVCTVYLFSMMSLLLHIFLLQQIFWWGQWKYYVLCHGPSIHLCPVWPQSSSQSAYPDSHALTRFLTFNIIPCLLSVNTQRWGSMYFSLTCHICFDAGSECKVNPPIGALWYWDILRMQNTRPDNHSIW